MRNVRVSAWTLVISLTVGAVLALLTTGWRELPRPIVERISHIYPHGPDVWTYDLRAAFFAKREAEPRSEFALLSINNQSLERYPAVKPVDRKLLAKLLDELDAAGAKAVGLALYFDRMTDTTADDALLASMNRMGGRLAVGALDSRAAGFSTNAATTQAAFLSQSPRIQQGHLYFGSPRSSAGQSPGTVVRTMRRHTANPNFVKRSFAEAVLSAAGIAPANVGQTDAVATELKRDDPGVPIAWLQRKTRDGSNTFLHLNVGASSPQTLETQPLLTAQDRQYIRGRIVIVGTDLEANDRHPTPFSAWPGGEAMTSVELHAQIAAQLVDGRRIRELVVDFGKYAEILLVFIIAALSYLIAYSRLLHPRNPTKIAGTIDYTAVTVLIIACAIAAFAFAELHVPSDAMGLASLLGVGAGHIGRNSRISRQVQVSPATAISSLQ